MKRKGRNEKDEAARIRELFLGRRTTYSPAEAARVTDRDAAELEQQIEEGHLVARKRYLLDKRTVLRLALDRWPLETIFAALGKDAEDLLPPLLRLERLELTVPTYVIRAIHYAAEREGKTPSALLRQIFQEYAVDVRARFTDEMDERMPELAEALFFPDKPWSKK